MCIQLFLDLILDKDKDIKLSLEFDAILGGLSIAVNAQYFSFS